jgi:predicted nucleotidyltransferase
VGEVIGLAVYTFRMITHDQIRRRREEIISVAQKYGASEIRIFGSVARGDANEESDLDLVVRFEPGRSLFDQGGLLMDLREMRGIRVHGVDEGALTGRFGAIVHREAVPL